MIKEPYDPTKGEESVWDYPRPPKLEAVRENIKIYFEDVLIVDTNKSFRVLETSHPPVYYIPPEDISSGVLKNSKKESFCEFKGKARYFSIEVKNKVVLDGCWYYPNPVPDFEAIKDFVAFYPSKMQRCEVAGEMVQAQKGDFYGGWITSKIKGPFKGGSGTWGW